MLGNALIYLAIDNPIKTETYNMISKLEMTDFEKYDIIINTFQLKMPNFWSTESLYGIV